MQPQPKTFHDRQIQTVCRPASALKQHTCHPLPALPVQVLAFISQPAGYGSIFPDEDYDHIFAWAQTGEHQNSLL